MPRRILWLGLAVIAAGAAVLRTVHLGAHLPHLVSPDEPTVMDRALALLDGETPREWDWPQGSMTVLAAAVGGVRATTGWLDGTPWLFGRVLFAGAGAAVVVLTGVLTASLTRRTTAAWLASAFVAVSYVSVRLSRSLQPDHLQAAFVLGALLCALHADRQPEAPRSRWWLAGAGALSGMAGATKYLGVLVVVPVAALILTRPSASRHRYPAETRGFRDKKAWVDLGVVAAGTVAGFVALAWGALVRPGAAWDGIADQFGHQAGGHLGYDGDTPGWWFHATTSLPDSWGWAVTLLAGVGIVLALARGDRAQRAVAAFAAGLFAVVGLSRVEFPHYVVIVLPLLAAVAASAVDRIGRLLAPGAAAAGIGLVVLSLVPALADDVRFVRASGADDTREVADATLADLEQHAPVWVERYASVPGRGTPIGDFGSRPDALGCRCFAVISSYMEQRFRREPERYAAQVENYRRLRAAGVVVTVVRPARPLPYNWDVLPRWGLRRLPLLDDISAAGPTLTILDLRHPRGAP